MKHAFLWGGGGAACELFHIITDLNRITPTYEIVAVVGKEPPNHPELRRFNFIDISVAGWKKSVDPSGCAFITTGYPLLREQMYREVKEIGLSLPVLIHPSAVVSADAEIAEGCIISPNTTISSLAKIGPNVYLSFNASIGHHSVIGEHSFFSPGTRVGARVDCGASVFTGMNAVILTGIRVGRSASISACALVASPVPEGATVVQPKSRIVRFN